ncbi:MAG: sulfite exporter TauE/SafE family protein [Firmicutes bacterium]|nr:sulfite exporter TauE/SafE family protein [Bacillota bacterium]
MITALIAIIILLHTFSTIMLAQDLRAHYPSFLKEPGRLLFQAPASFILNFLSGFGISDFALSTALYLKVGWAEPRKLPGTLTTQNALPVMIFSIAYISGIKVDLGTLIPVLAAHMLGAFLSPKIVMSLPLRRIRQLLACGLLFAGFTICASKLGFLHLGGQALSLQGYKLAAAIICYFLIGALKAMGVPGYPLSMSATFFLGLHPLVSYPLMMGGGALSAPLVLIRYIKLDGYMRKLTLLGSTAGVLGGCLAVFIVKSLDISFLQWLVVAVVFYAAIDILLNLRRETQSDLRKSIII